MPVEMTRGRRSPAWLLVGVLVASAASPAEASRRAATIEKDYSCRRSAVKRGPRAAVV